MRRMGSSSCGVQGPRSSTARWLLLVVDWLRSLAISIDSSWSTRSLISPRRGILRRLVCVALRLREGGSPSGSLGVASHRQRSGAPEAPIAGKPYEWGGATLRLRPALFGLKAAGQAATRAGTQMSAIPACAERHSAPGVSFPRADICESCRSSPFSALLPCLAVSESADFEPRTPGPPDQSSFADAR